MMNPGDPVWVLVTMAAWLACGIYFIASAFATQRIREKESGAKRTWDSVLLLGGYLCLFLHFSNPAAAWDRRFLPPGWEAPLGIAGTVAAVVGLAFTAWARASLGRYWSRVVALKQDHKLVQSGPYQWVRHPLYTGILLASLGTAFAIGMWHAWLGVALLWTGFIYRAYREDALLAGQFGADFAAYRARSGRLLPHFGGAREQA